MVVIQNDDPKKKEKKKMPSEERFNSTNWVNWKSTIWAAMESHGLTGYLSGDIEQPSPVPQPAELLSTFWGSSDLTLN
jgi:hypothetical protein